MIAGWLEILAPVIGIVATALVALWGAIRHGERKERARQIERDAKAEREISKRVDRADQKVRDLDDAGVRDALRKWVRPDDD